MENTQLNDIQSNWLNNKRPFLFSGPCSAESEEQVLQTAEQLAATKRVHAYRVGLWKPRTHPGDFEGVGIQGLPWLKQVKQKYGFLVGTEVATEKHVYECLKHGIDILWIGARTTTNPFAVQEVADALSGTDVIVLVKNPMNPDLELWIGAIERIYKSGIRKIGAIHRGFSTYEKTNYRNSPKWQIALDFRRRCSQIPLICDPSHMSGHTDFLLEVSQRAIDLNYDGLMIESHINPEKALSDKKQQITPNELAELMSRIIFRAPTTQDQKFLDLLGELRSQIDTYDEHLLEILENRMKVSEKIGQYKKDNGIVIFQGSRWDQIMDRMIHEGSRRGMSAEFIEKIFRAIHEESISHQVKVMNK